MDLAGYTSWAYVVIALLVALDAVLPLVPGETAVIAGAAMAAQGRLGIVGVVVAAAAGAFLGDLTSYGCGRLLGPPVRRTLARGRRGAALLDWAHDLLERRGAPFLVIARFVPGGRTASTLSAGLLRVAAGRFVVCIALGSVLWTGYVVGLGYVGGSMFAINPLVVAVIAVGVATLVGVGAHLAMGPRRRRSARVTEADVRQALVPVPGGEPANCR